MYHINHPICRIITIASGCSDKSSHTDATLKSISLLKLRLLNVFSYPGCHLKFRSCSSVPRFGIVKAADSPQKQSWSHLTHSSWQLAERDQLPLKNQLQLKQGKKNKKNHIFKYSPRQITESVLALPVAYSQPVFSLKCVMHNSFPYPPPHQSISFPSFVLQISQTTFSILFSIIIVWSFSLLLSSLLK